MRVMLNDVIVASAEKVVVGVRKLETLVSKTLQAILRAQEEVLAKAVVLHRAKAQKRYDEAKAEVKEILENAKAKAERLNYEADDAFCDAINERCKLIDKKHDLLDKRLKGL